MAPAAPTAVGRPPWHVLHRDDCWIDGGLSRAEAAEDVARANVESCELCRPDPQHSGP
jgi:hypothetical protein